MHCRYEGRYGGEVSGFTVSHVVQRMQTAQLRILAVLDATGQAGFFHTVKYVLSTGISTILSYVKEAIVPHGRGWGSPAGGDLCCFTPPPLPLVQGVG